MAEYREFVEQTGLTAFVQTTAETADGMLAQAKALQAYFGEHFVVKLPAVPEGYRAVRLCKAAGIPVCVTVVHSMTQALVAAAAGAYYVAPYVSRIDNLGADGIQTAKIIQDMFTNNGLKCEILAASFKNSQQVQALAQYGVGAATIAPAVIEGLVKNAAVAAAIDDFTRDFEGLCGKGITMKDAN